MLLSEQSDEYQTARLIAYGFSHDEIAEHFGVSLEDLESFIFGDDLDIYKKYKIYRAYSVFKIKPVVIAKYFGLKIGTVTGYCSEIGVKERGYETD